MSNTTGRLPDYETQLVAFDRASSTFERGLDQLAAGFAAMETALHATRHAGLPLPQLADALLLARQQFTVARSTLAFGADEPGMQRHADSEQWLAEQLEAKIRAGTDVRTIARFHEEFLEHEPAARIAMVCGLHAAWSVRQVSGRLGGEPRPDAATSRQLEEARSFLGIARRHLDVPDEPFGPRYARYLERYAQLADELAHELAPA